MERAERNHKRAPESRHTSPDIMDTGLSREEIDKLSPEERASIGEYEGEPVIGEYYVSEPDTRRGRKIPAEELPLQEERYRHKPSKRKIANTYIAAARANLMRTIHQMELDVSLELSKYGTREQRKVKSFVLKKTNERTGRPVTVAWI